MECKRRKLSSNNRKIIARKKVESKNIADRLPKLSYLEKRVNETVIGQEDVVRSVCTKIYESLYFPQLKSNILIVGKSGTGKTEIIRQISAHLKIPCVIEDATKYTEEGYSGASVSEMLNHLIDNANGDISLASKGIIFIDEIDKKTSNGDRQSDISREGVLRGLLKMVEGTKIKVANPKYSDEDPESEMTIEFDTSNVIFLFGGAFVGLEKIKEKRLKKNNTIGFTSAEANHIVINNYMNTTFTKEDLIEYGLPAEFVGRISSIYETKELQVEDLKRILAYSKKSEFKKYEKIFWRYGIELIYSDNLFELIAKNAKKTSTGARELNSLVSHMFEKIMYDTFSNPVREEYTKCILDDEIVSDNTKYYWK